MEWAAALEAREDRAVAQADLAMVQADLAVVQADLADLAVEKAVIKTIRNKGRGDTYLR